MLVEGSAVLGCTLGEKESAFARVITHLNRCKLSLFSLSQLHLLSIPSLPCLALTYLIPLLQLTMYGKGAACTR